MKLDSLCKDIPALFRQREECALGEYTCLKYPRVLSFIRMDVKQYRIPGFGYLMCMATSAMGIMKLSTFSFTPSEGVSVPFLLIDTMRMGKKRLAYVELYDCRKEKTEIPALGQLEKKYRAVQDYREKPAWYVGERMKGSLIKCASPEEEDILYRMVIDAVQTYLTVADGAGRDPGNLEGLRKFSARMMEEGNPSSGTLNAVLGKEKAADFFKAVVMPV